jgi:hypothetical protein
MVLLLNVLFIAIALLINTASAVPQYICEKEGFCGYPLVEFTVVCTMGLITRSDERLLSVTRAGVALKSGDAYACPDTLTVTLSNGKMDSEALLTTTAPGAYKDGCCAGTKKTLAEGELTATLIIPADATGTVVITGLWAYSKNNGILLSTAFSLTECAKPQQAPTGSPSSEPIEPSSKPKTLRPASKKPSAPSAMPSKKPYVKPVDQPFIKPTCKVTSKPTRRCSKPIAKRV